LASPDADGFPDFLSMFAVVVVVVVVAAAAAAAPF
jgi:hypothetical protein